MKIYILKSIACEEVHYKVCISSNEPKRVQELLTGTPFGISIYRYYTVPAKKAKQIERAIHSYLVQFHVFGEWFCIPDMDSWIRGIEELIAFYGGNK